MKEINDVSLDSYESPAIEIVLKDEDLDREVMYAAAGGPISELY